MSIQNLDRRMTAEDYRVLHHAAQRGKVYLRWPQDEEWLRELPDIGDPLNRLRGMRRRGSLAPLAHKRWLIMPEGASSLEQGAPIKVLLTAALDGRADWYLGYLSALTDHGLTDIDSEGVYVAVKGTNVSLGHTLGAMHVHVVRHHDDTDWTGVERERVTGRVFAYRSGIARTLLDTLEHPRRCGPAEIWVRAWERAMREQRVEPQTLVDMAETRSQVVQARLAFWLHETGHIRPARHIMRALGGPLKGPRLLDSAKNFGAGPWKRDHQTGLVLNLPEATIDGWLEYGK
jgi:predicted transcriptional regulator of viral defense system